MKPDEAMRYLQALYGDVEGMIRAAKSGIFQGREVKIQRVHDAEMKREALQQAMRALRESDFLRGGSPAVLSADVGEGATLASIVSALDHPKLTQCAPRAVYRSGALIGLGVAEISSRMGFQPNGPEFDADDLTPGPTEWHGLLDGEYVTVWNYGDDQYSVYGPEPELKKLFGDHYLPDPEATVSSRHITEQPSFNQMMSMVQS